MIILHVDPKKRFSEDEWMVFVMLFGWYLALMVVAMYPGRAPMALQENSQYRS